MKGWWLGSLSGTSSAAELTEGFRQELGRSKILWSSRFLGSGQMENRQKRDSRDTEWTGCRHSWRSTSTKRKLLETWFFATIPPQSVVWRKRHRFSSWFRSSCRLSRYNRRFSHGLTFGYFSSHSEATEKGNLNTLPCCSYSESKRNHESFFHNRSDVYTCCEESDLDRVTRWGGAIFEDSLVVAVGWLWGKSPSWMCFWPDERQFGFRSWLLLEIDIRIYTEIERPKGTFLVKGVSFSNPSWLVRYPFVKIPAVSSWHAGRWSGSPSSCQRRESLTCLGSECVDPCIGKARKNQMLHGRIGRWLIWERKTLNVRGLERGLTWASLHFFWALFFLWRNFNYEIQIFFAADNSRTFDFFYFIHFNNPQQLILLPPFFIRLCHRHCHCRPFRCGERGESGFGCRALNRQPLLVDFKWKKRISFDPKTWNDCCTGTPSWLVLAMLQPAVCLSIFLRHVRLLTKTLYSLWKCC